jgi:hypothetical protein
MEAAPAPECAPRQQAGCDAVMARRIVRMAHTAAIVGYIDGQPNRYRTLREENIKAMMAPPGSRRACGNGDSIRARPARWPSRDSRTVLAGRNAAFSCA